METGYWKQKPEVLSLGLSEKMVNIFFLMKLISEEYVSPYILILSYIIQCAALNVQLNIL